MRPPDAIAQLTLESEAVSGRKNPISSGYRPHMRLAGQENGVSISLLGCNELHPGDTCNVEMRFHARHLLTGRLRVGSRFELAEGRIVVAYGYFAEIYHRDLLTTDSRNSKRAIFVDVDDTLIRTAATKRIPLERTIDYVKKMHDDGHTLYLWTRGGASYAREVACDLGIEDCFEAFLPKPDQVLDDMLERTLRHCEFVHPNEALARLDEPCD